MLGIMSSSAAAAAASRMIRWRSASARSKSLLQRSAAACGSVTPRATWNSVCSSRMMPTIGSALPGDARQRFVLAADVVLASALHPGFLRHAVLQPIALELVEGDTEGDPALL